MAQKIPLWLDCDPGHDDAIAIILAAHNPRLELLGISTVSGNQTVDKTTINAIKMLEAVGRPEIPVYKGAGKPLLRFTKNDPEIHGESGLDGTDLLPALDEQRYIEAYEKNAIEEMAKAIFASEEKVSLVALGPLTNIALLVCTYPAVVSKIKILSFMGGALKEGNRSAVAEFNILCDPEAAQIVMQAGFENLVMVPLDVTHKAIVTQEVLDRIKNSVDPVNSNFCMLVTDILLFFKSTYSSAFGFHSGPPLHDPLAVFYVLEPYAFSSKLMRVDVECGFGMCAGQTVCDIWDYEREKPKNCLVTQDIDLYREKGEFKSVHPVNDDGGSGSENNSIFEDPRFLKAVERYNNQMLPTSFNQVNWTSKVLLETIMLPFLQNFILSISKVLIGRWKRMGGFVG
ncbi:hypothetical protein BB560_005544, partial [Smittium megazygosporum]